MLRMPSFRAEHVWLAPMSGSTDAAFRRQAARFGAPAVVSEMVAGEALAANRADMVRKTCRHDGDGLWIVQLAGRRPKDMRKGAELLAEAGVDVIDINMGCPARKVTGGNSGSALMREPDLAMQIIEATLEGAMGKPVTLKMRLGWDNDLLNAPEIAQRAVDRGIELITVHGRTRCQFYKGHADWSAIRATVDAVDVPVIANGDIHSVADADAALVESGAFGVMVGRSAMGQPWLLGEIEAARTDTPYEKPGMSVQCDSLCEQIEDSMSLYGEKLGLRMVRKHIAAYIDHVDLPFDEAERRDLRSILCQFDEAAPLIRNIREIYAGGRLKVAA